MSGNNLETVYFEHPVEVGHTWQAENYEELPFYNLKTIYTVKSVRLLETGPKKGMYSARVAIKRPIIKDDKYYTWTYVSKQISKFKYELSKKLNHPAHEFLENPFKTVFGEKHITIQLIRKGEVYTKQIKLYAKTKRQQQDVFAA